MVWQLRRKREGETEKREWGKEERETEKRERVKPWEMFESDLISYFLYLTGKGMTENGKRGKNPSDLHFKHKTLERNHENEEEDDDGNDDSSEEDDEEETLRSSLRSRNRGLSTPSSSSSSSSSASSPLSYSILFCLLHQRHSSSSFSTMLLLPTKIPFLLTSSSPLFPFLIYSILFYFLSFLNASFPSSTLFQF